MPRIITVPFSADLIDTALEQISDPCRLVFPTEISAARARQRFMADWQLQDCEFISMKELKNDLLLPEIPSVSDDKRMLCLYQSLTDEDRQHFHINGYFDIVEWGNHFFQFFGELSDECVEVAKLSTPFESFGINLLGWQEEYLQKVLAIHARYRARLAKLGLTDPIFFLRGPAVKVPCRDCRFVFVNQYYFSRLEKQLIKDLEAAGNEVLVISQSCGPDMDPEQLTTPEIRLEELTEKDIRTQKIEVVECENEEQMILQFLSQSRPNEEVQRAKAVIADSKFARKHYKSLFDPRYYSFSQSVSMVDSGIYLLLHTFKTHLLALNSTQEKRFIPIRLILDASTSDAFIRYYQENWGLAEKTALLDEIKTLLEASILYVDYDLNPLDRTDLKGEFPHLRQILAPHFELLNNLANIGSPGALVNLIDSGDGLEVRKMCSEQELLYSNILDQFYERLANFTSLEKTGIVSSWADLFGCAGSELACAILQLFLESLASASIRFRFAMESNPAFEVSNLLDLRNLGYDTTVFFHAIEGEIPANPGPAWLLNESQRNSIGLKSYPELRHRERYYFMRQVFNSSQTIIYTYRNMEKDIEPGSFITELLLAQKERKLPGVKCQSKKYLPKISSLYTARFANRIAGKDSIPGLQDPSICWLNRSDDQDGFFVLPSDPENDFGPSHEIKAPYYSLSLIKKNPFAWYLECWRKIRKIELRPEETITRMLFGTIMHGFLSSVMGRLADASTRFEDLAKAFEDSEELAKALYKLLNDPDQLYRYQIPQNYNYTFLLGIISDSLVKSMQQFYLDFLKPNLKDTSFLLIPEQEDERKYKGPHKLLACPELDGISYRVRIKGRADLRIECPQVNYIVDFKTKSFEIEQLVFYEWYYYLLDGSIADKSLKSLIWKIFDQEPDGKEITDEMRENWKEDVKMMFESCFTSGYRLGNTAKDRQQLARITRADLFRINREVLL